MPEWMLREGVEFTAYIDPDLFSQQSLDGVNWFNITPQEYSHLSNEELANNLNRTFARLLSQSHESLSE
jgi:hypothetical protein